MKRFTSERFASTRRPVSLWHTLKCMLGMHQWLNSCLTTEILLPWASPNKIGEIREDFCRHCGARHRKMYFRSRNAFNDYQAIKKGKNK